MDAFLLDSSSLVLYGSGYVYPPLAMVIFVCNTLACIVLIQKHMRNPTNMLLMAMAISDMLTVATPGPSLLYFYTMGHYKDYVPAKWCQVYHVTTIYMPTIFHTASIWITVTLAILRYICVCHPLVAKQLCTIPNVVKSIFGIYIMAVLLCLGFFVEVEYVDVEVPSRNDPTKNVSGCTYQNSSFVTDYGDIYFNINYWLRIVFVYMLPCLLLVILNGILINTMYVATKRRQVLLKQQRETECRKLQESIRTTLMLVVVVGLFLLVELPSGLLECIIIIEFAFNLDLIPLALRHVTSACITFCILLSYPLNLVIYCGMSKQFRETFKLFFTRTSSD